MKWYLVNEKCETIATFEVFDAEAIKAKIIEYLTENKNGLLTYERDFEGAEKRKYFGKKVIDVFENNPKNGKPSKCVRNDKYVTL